MEIVLNSNEHKVNDYCLRFELKETVRFINQHNSLTSIIFYKFFENIDNNFKSIVKYNNQSHIVTFSNGVYNVSDINEIVNQDIKEKFNVEDEPIKIAIDINTYNILIIIKENWSLILDENFSKLLGFSKYILNPRYNRSDLIANIDRTKYLKIYCNIVNNRNMNFLTNVFIKGNISDIALYDSFNIYKKQKILETEFRYIEVCIKNQNNENIGLKDFYQIALYIS